MSGLTGIWNLDGEPVSPEILSAMSARLAHRGPDGCTERIAGPVGFACQMLRTTPESLAETQPVADTQGCLLVWDGRLDNREELFHRLRATTELSKDSPDPVLVLAAYSRYASDFPLHLEGEFALALHDPSKRQLLLARDVMGARTLDYCRFGDHFLFASETKALLVHPAVETAPNDERLVEWIYRLPDYSDESSTFFRNIHTVPAGTVVTVRLEGISSRRYWDFDPEKRLKLKRYEDYVEAYKESYAKAVRRRLRSAYPVAIAVSGGLDSSSNYCTAIEEMRRTPTPCPDIFGIALVGEHPSTDESIYQRAVEEKAGKPLFRIPFETANTREEIETDTWHGEGPYIKSLAWRSHFRTAAEQGARVILSGYFGDHLLLNPQYMLDLARCGRFFTLGRHLRMFYDWWDGYPASASTKELWGYFKGYMVPDSIRPLYHGIRRRLSRQKTLELPWYSARFAATAERFARRAKVLRYGSSDFHQRVLVHQTRSRMNTLRLQLDLKVDARFPCEQVYPFRDRQFVELVMSIPGEVLYAHGSRGIHRDAMAGILPELVRRRTSKTTYTQPFVQGALDDLASLGPSLEGGLADRMGYLAKQHDLRNALKDLRTGLQLSHNASKTWLILDLLGLEAWLSVYFSGGETGLIGFARDRK